MPWINVCLEKPVAHLYAEDLIRDAERNSVSLINLIEEINAPNYPVFIPKFAVFLLLEREEHDTEEKYDGVLKLLSNNQELFNFNVTYSFEDKRRTRTTIKFDGLTVPSPGTFSTAFYVNDKLLSQKVLNANLLTEPPRVKFG